MEVISISLAREHVEKIERLMGVLGVRSRSKLIRASLESLNREHAFISELEGTQTVVFMVSQKKAGGELSRIMHEFKSVIKTNIHHHSPKGCLDILITEGDAEVMKSMYRAITNSSRPGSVSVSIV
jgi:metal-responsive CopG/Arc/MetJ family transcriptional regulator